MEWYNGYVKYWNSNENIGRYIQDRNKVLDEFAPAAARQLINIVVYAVTHGNISDYNNYIPASALTALTDGEAESVPKTVPNTVGKF